MRAWPCQAAAAGGAFAPILPQRRGPLGPTRWGLGSRSAWPGPRWACAICAAARKGVSSSLIKQCRAFGRSGLGRNPSERSRSRTGPSLFSPGARLAGLFGGSGRLGQSGLRSVRKSDGIFFHPLFSLTPPLFPPRYPRSASPSSLFCFPCLRSPKHKKNGRGPLLRSLPDRMRRGGEAQGRIRSGLNPIRSRGRKTDSACRFSRRFRRRL